MKNDYNKDYFWIKTDPEDHTKHYFFNINENLVEVTKEVFNTCYASYKKMTREIIEDKQAGLISMNIEVNQISLIDQIKEEDSILENVIRKEKLDKVLQMINKLDEQDRKLMINLLIYEKSQKELADMLHMSQQGISKRKSKIIKKFQENFKNWL